MVYTEIKKRNDKKYFYRTLSVRENQKVYKKRIYLGKNLSKQELEKKEIEANKEIYTFKRKRKGNEFEKIKKHQGKIKGLVLDGWFRTAIEALLMDEALEWYEWNKNVKIFLLHISRKESFDRLTKRRQCRKCGRLIPWLGEFKELKKCDKCKGRRFIRGDESMG